MLNIKVSGMTCGCCVATVTRAVQSVHPGLAVAVDLKQGEVTIPDEADAEAVRWAIAAAGYDAIVSPSLPEAAALSEPIPALKASCCCG